MHASLFSGIGGFDLAAEWVGWKNSFHCENNKFSQQVLKYYWPNSISYDDIKTTNFTIHNRTIDVLTGGFPCQPYSVAGKRLGKADDRHLWPEMLRAIREIQPSYILGENVYGLVNWKRGLVFKEIIADMEAEGYQVQSFILPADSKNAPHRRYRVWFIAHSNLHGYKLRRFRKNRFKKEKSHIKKQKRQWIWKNIRRNGKKVNITNSNYVRLRRKNNWVRKTRQFNKAHTKPNWENFPTQSPICWRNDGFPAKLDGITFPKWRNESIKAYGNAIVPQIAYEIFKVIDKLIKQ